MDTTTLWVIAANLLFVIACGVIGVRLILLWRRTRELPELCLGGGFCCFIVGIPAIGIAGMGRVAADQIHLPLASFGMLLLAIGMTCMAAFTWRAFRPTAAWAAMLVGMAAAINAGIGMGTIHAIANAPVGSPAADATRLWIFWLRIPMMLSCCWTVGEAWHGYRMVVRRAAIGLGDPVVANRLLLWCLTCVVAIANGVVGSVLHLNGMGPTSDPVAAAALAVGSAVSAGFLYLVFMPPERYLRFIEDRAAAHA